jgi:hypothetical protein
MILIKGAEISVLPPAILDARLQQKDTETCKKQKVNDVLEEITTSRKDLPRDGETT